jgi:hypothetical protein
METHDPSLVSNNASVTLSPNPLNLPGKVAPTVASSVVAPYPHDNNNLSYCNTIHANSTTPNDNQITVTKDRETSLIVKPSLTCLDACDAVHSLKPIKLTDQLTSLPLIDNDDFEAFEEFHSYILDQLQHPSSSDFFISLSDWLDDFLEADADIEVLWNCMETINSYLIDRLEIMTDPIYLEALAAYEYEPKSYTELTHLIVALNQPSSSAAERSAADELIYWNFLCDGTEAPVMLSQCDSCMEKWYYKYLQQRDGQSHQLTSSNPSALVNPVIECPLTDGIHPSIDSYD